MLDKKRNEVITFHLQLSKTLKELKHLLPAGFMKNTYIYSPKVTTIKNKNISLISTKKSSKDEQEKNETVFIQTNKNVDDSSLGYATSEGNKSQKKILAKITNYFYFPFNKYKSMSKTAPNHNNINFIDNNYMNKTKKKEIKIPKFRKTLKNLKELNNKYKTKSDMNFYLNDIRFIHPLMTIRKNFKGSLIDNSMMKANMCLPTLTDRLKSKLPRYEREKYGFLLKNYKSDNYNKNEDSEKELQLKKYKLINVNKHYFKDNKLKKDKKIQLSNSFLKQMKMNESLDIKSAKKTKQEF